MFMAFLCGIFSSADLGRDSFWGLCFIVVFAINVVIMAFEFPRTTSITIVFIAIAVGLGAILLNQQVEIFPSLQHHVDDLAPKANAEFYWMIAGLIAIVLGAVVLVHRYIDYWELLSNELIHHHGMLGNLERFPAPGIKLEKEINDVFEFLLLRSGRLVLTVPYENRAIVLDNVPHINRVERFIKEVLGVTEVEINQT